MKLANDLAFKVAQFGNDEAVGRHHRAQRCFDAVAENSDGTLGRLGDDGLEGR